MGAFAKNTGLCYKILSFNNISDFFHELDYRFCAPQN
jgi:hypothetical protein